MIDDDFYKESRRHNSYDSAATRQEQKQGEADIKLFFDCERPCAEEGSLGGRGQPVAVIKEVGRQFFAKELLVLGRVLVEDKHQNRL